MPLNIDALRETRKTALATAKAVVDRAEAEGRSLTSEDVAAIDKANADFDRVDDLITRFEEDEKRAAAVHESRERMGLTRSHAYSPAQAGKPLLPGQHFRDLFGGKAATDEDFGNYARALVRGEHRAAEGTGPTGGYLVPTPLSATVLDLARSKTTVIAAGAQIVPMTAETLRLAKIEQDPQPGWRNESQAIAVSDITFGQVNFTARSLAVLVKCSWGLAEDANYDDLIDATARVYGKNYSPTAAILSTRSEAGLAKLKDDNGAYLAAPSYLADLPRLATTAVKNDQTQGTATAASDLFVADFSQLFIGVRTEFQLKALTERFADTGEVGFVGWLRADVQIGRPDAFQVVTGAL